MMTSPGWIFVAVAIIVVAAVVALLVAYRRRRRQRRRNSRQDYARAYHNNMTREQIAERGRAERARLKSQVQG